MNLRMTHLKPLLAVAVLVAIGGEYRSAYAKKGGNTPHPAKAPNVIAAQKAMGQAQKKYNEARSEVTKARMDVQKALRNSAGQDTSGGHPEKSPALIDAELNHQKIKSQLDETGKKLLLTLSDNRELLAMHERIKELKLKLRLMQAQITSQQALIQANSDLIKAGQALRRLEEKLLSDFPEYQTLQEKLKQAELVLREARKDFGSQRRNKPEAARADNPEAAEAKARLEQLVNKTKEVNTTYRMAKSKYNREVAIATEKYKQFLARKAREKQEKRIRDAERENRRRRDRNYRNRHRRW